VVEFLIEKLHDPKMMAAVFAAIAAMATVITLAMPILAGDNLGKRMKSVALEREASRGDRAGGWPRAWPAWPWPGRVSPRAARAALAPDR